MKTFVLSILLLSWAVVPGSAQQWEFGGMGGAGFLSGVPVSASFGAATAGFQTGAAVGAFFGQNMYPHFSGELRYGFMQSNLRLSSGGSEASFAGRAHVLHYDFIWHTNRTGSRVQFFVAAGGGLKVFDGTGQEAAYQPLYQYGYFTKTRVTKPMASVGAGLRYLITPKLSLRTEFRDYITAFPTELIAPAPNTKYGSILHTFVPMVGISYLF